MLRSEGQRSTDDELVPVRAVNAHRFCPRLYWLEYVEGIFLDNEHTIRGQHVHRRVDRPGGRLTAPSTYEKTGDAEGEDAAEAETWHARSLWLSCAELGVSGKLDLVEEQKAAAPTPADDTAIAGTLVMPVDTKKGRSRDGELWPADEVQLTLQALLLRSAGYRVERIAAWYDSERRRVVSELTPELEARAHAEVEATRGVRDGDKAPPPLEGSSRCLGCSLNAACLPDEVRRLAAEVEAESDEGAGEIRRVVPPRDDRTPVYVQANGAVLRKTGRELVIEPRAGGEKRKLGLDRVAQINVYGQVHVTQPLLEATFEQGIPVCFFSGGGWYRGRTMTTSNRQVHVRIAQHAAVQGMAGLCAAHGRRQDRQRADAAAAQPRSRRGG